MASHTLELHFSDVNMAASTVHFKFHFQHHFKSILTSSRKLLNKYCTLEMSRRTTVANIMC